MQLSCKMRVLYIVDYGTVGGATQSFIEMVIALKGHGVDPIVLTGKKTDLNNLLKKKNIENYVLGHRTVLEPIVHQGYKWPLRFLKKFCTYYVCELIAKIRLHQICPVFSGAVIIHTNSARNDIGCYISKKYGIPHIMHIREFADSDFNCIPFNKNYIYLYNCFTTKFVSISDAVRNHWIKKGIDKSKILTIYNGVDNSDISISSNMSKMNKELRIVMVGGVVFPKGQHIAVEAFGLIPEDIRRNLHLDIVGWSVKKYLLKLKKEIKRLNLNNISFLGARSDVHNILGSYQIGLMCSRSEGFGRVTAEYMHAQLGVIASNSGANKELIEDCESGLIFDNMNPRSLADAIIKYYNNRPLLLRCSANAKQKANIYYTVEKNASNIYNLYKSII